MTSAMPQPGWNGTYQLVRTFATEAALEEEVASAGGPVGLTVGGVVVLVQGAYVLYKVIHANPVQPCSSSGHVNPRNTPFPGHTVGGPAGKGKIITGGVPGGAEGAPGAPHDYPVDDLDLSGARPDTGAGDAVPVPQNVDTPRGTGGGPSNKECWLCSQPLSHAASCDIDGCPGKR